MSESMLEKADTIDGLYLVCFVLTGIAFAIWLASKVRENEPVSTGPWWSYVIPLVNWFMLFRAVWNLHQKAGARVSESTVQVAIILWAIAFTGGGLLGRWAGNANPETDGEVRQAFQAFIAGDAILVLAAVLCAFLVTQVASYEVRGQPLPALPSAPAPTIPKLAATQGWSKPPLKSQPVQESPPPPMRTALRAEEASAMEAEVIPSPAWACRACGHANRESNRFCTSCGNDSMRTCSHCGVSLLDTDSFCGSCGTPIGPIRQYAGASTPSSIQERGEAKARSVAYATALAVTVSLALGLGIGFILVR